MPFSNLRQPNLPDYLVFLREAVGISVDDLPDDSPFIPGTYAMAAAAVNTTLCLAPMAYSLARYNFGADRVINFAIDQPNRVYFAKLRKDLGILSFAAGLVSSSSGDGASQSLEVIEAAKGMTVTDLQLMKTPYGRQYIGLAQSYGPTIWGLS